MLPTVTAPEINLHQDVSCVSCSFLLYATHTDRPSLHTSTHIQESSEKVRTIKVGDAEGGFRFSVPIKINLSV